LLGSNGRYIDAYYSSDRVHFNAAGYEVWTDILRPALMAGEETSIALPQFQSGDVGAVAEAGFSAVDGGTLTVSGSGAGIYGSLDGFHYTWKQLIGNGQITARIASQTNTSDDAVAGIMLREKLTANSRFAFAFTTPGVGSAMAYRATTASGAVPVIQQQPGVNAPYWLRLVRKSGTITCFQSATGISWTQCGKAKLANLKKTIYVGLAVSSAADGFLTSATFDNVWIHGSTVSPPAP
jgi:hypothetical protein